MHRERALKIVLVFVGLLFCAAVYPLFLMVKQDPALAMMMSLYATLGVFCCSHPAIRPRTAASLLLQHGRALHTEG
jgi:hypothetical protein